LREEFNPSERSLVAATVTIAATYIYFLIFAQFGFLKALAVLGPENTLLRPLMAVMGAAGIAGSVGMARWFNEKRCRGQMMVGFVIAGVAAGLTWLARSPAIFFVSAALTGAGTGMVTVGLAGILRQEIGGSWLGRCIGIGTGVAYAFCNLPPVFGGGASTQAMLGIAAACTGLIAVQLFEQRGPRQKAGGYDYSAPGIGLWAGIFLVLVGLDSAAFYIIQHNPELKLATWAGGPRLFLNAGVHLAAGVAAGVLLDRRWMAGTVGVAAGWLIAACALLNLGSGRYSLEAALYAAGVSVYSAALVFYPARAGRPGLAALVFAVAGWTGSALGISLAQDLNRLPNWFLGAAGGLLAALFFIRWNSRRARALVILGLLGAALPSSRTEAAEAVAAGRRVYIAEGCMHCHSQYVRPGTVDMELWGPPQPLAAALAQEPPLIGNRRQGPDLQNIGLRRTRGWNRAHLIAPRAVFPGSRMPAYPYLFTGEAGRGEALLDYLAALGRPAKAVQ
jgi:cytochrome c oxidase cbb3-type subunit 2